MYTQACSPPPKIKQKCEIMDRKSPKIQKMKFEKIIKKENDQKTF